LTSNLKGPRTIFGVWWKYYNPGCHCKTTNEFNAAFSALPANVVDKWERLASRIRKTVGIPTALEPYVMLSTAPHSQEGHILTFKVKGYVENGVDAGLLKHNAIHGV
jgi:hypothetical protein